MIFITHDLRVAGADVRPHRGDAERRDGRVRRVGSKVLSNPQHPYTQKLIDAVPRLRAAGRHVREGGLMPCALRSWSDVLDMHYLAPAVREHCPDIDLRLGSDLGPLDQIDAAVCWFPPHGLLASLPQLQLVQSLAAGVDHITADPRLPRRCRCAASSIRRWPRA